MATAEQIKEVMRALGKRTSKRKAASSAENGKLGGRPRTRKASNSKPISHPSK